MLSFFPRGVLDEILNLIESVSEDFPSHSSTIKYLFYGAPSGSEPSLFFSNYLLGLEFKPVQDNFQHEFSRMTDEADISVFLAEL